MTITPEKFAEISARMEARKARLKPKPKPKVVVSDTRNAAGRPEVIRDADVVVSRADPNARHATDGVVEVRRPPLDPRRVTINDAAADAAYWDRVNAQAADRQRRRDADPFGMGHWGSHDD
jgi:hypothetical protein